MYCSGCCDGLGILIYGAYLSEHKYAPPSIATAVAILGAFLLLTGLSSWGGNTYSEAATGSDTYVTGMTWPMGCSHALMFSSYLCLPVALFELIMAIVLLSSTSKITTYMEEHQIDISMQNQVTNPALALIIFGMSIMVRI
jgi:hypothetical protein